MRLLRKLARYILARGRCVTCNRHVQFAEYELHAGQCPPPLQRLLNEQGAPNCATCDHRMGLHRAEPDWRWLGPCMVHGCSCGAYLP